MPTIKHEPKWGSPAGYTQQVFTKQQVEHFAKFLGCSATALGTPLQEVASALSLLRYTQPIPLLAQRAALRELVDAADSLHTKLTQMDADSRSRVLSEYASECREAASPEAPAARYHARDQLDTDMAAVSRLCSNLGTATKRINKDIRRGAPRKEETQFAAEKLIDLYEGVLGIEFVNSTDTKKRVPRQFVLEALALLGVDGPSATGAIGYAIKARRKRKTELPAEPG